jgi:hypothetical protein
LEREKEGHAAPQQAKSHQRERRKKQVATTECIYGIDGGNRKYEIGDASAHARQKSLGLAESRVSEDGGRVICDDIHTTKLLHEHDEESTLRSTTIAAYTEELLPEAAAFSLGSLGFEQLVGVVHVTSRLDLMLAEAADGIERLVKPALLHVPDKFLVNGEEEGEQFPYHLGDSGQK